MPSVLIVEDDVDVREFVDVFLRTSGYETVCAANGQEALDRMREQRPCLVLLDIQMPVMDGFQFRARQLRDPALADVPVLCITAVYDPEQVTREIGLRCLSKPADFDALLGEVETACGASSDMN